MGNSKKDQRMIFGKTPEEAYNDAHIKRKKLLSKGNVKWFAWYPTRINDGRTVWLQYIYYRWYPYGLEDLLIKFSLTPLDKRG
jgi:hypothetical protein